MATGYEDIEQLTSQQNTMLDESLKQQQDIVNKQTQMNIDALERGKAEVDQQTAKTNQGLYTEYKKASNPYGINAELNYAKGLGNSGYSETTQTNLYNTYQKNVTDTINNAQKLKSDFDFQMNQARQNGDIVLAQNALQIYNQKMQLLTQEYELKNNREQFLYQKEQDAIAQGNWEKEFARQQQRDTVADQQYAEQFAYQKEQDTLSQSNWEKEFLRQQQRDSVADSQYAEQFAYQKGRDQVSDSQWRESFDYQKGRDAVSDQQYAEQMAYQKERDAVSDSQWAKEHALAKSKASSSYNVINTNDSNGNNGTSGNAQKLYSGISGLLNSNNSKVNQETARQLIYNERNKGTISDEEASVLFKEFGL